MSWQKVVAQANSKAKKGVILEGCYFGKRNGGRGSEQIKEQGLNLKVVVATIPADSGQLTIYDPQNLQLNYNWFVASRK